MVLIQALTELSSLAGIRQWGYSKHGHVVFPIQFTSFRQITLSHAGVSFMIAKASEGNSLDGFTLSVKNLSEEEIVL